MKSYKTIQIESHIKDQLDRVAKKNGWPISHIVGRLIQRYVNGDFSGSLADVIRKDDENLPDKE